MLVTAEIHKVDPRFEWVEVRLELEDADEAIVIRQVVGENQREMTQNLLERLAAKVEDLGEAPAAQRRALEELLEEACMAKVMLQQSGSSDMTELFPTNIINFKHPQRTSFRKSRSVRVQMFMDEGFAFLQQRRFDDCMDRLDKVHHLDPTNEEAFQYKVICLRSARRTEKCVQVFEQWIEHHPQELSARLGLGEMWLYLEQYTRAKTVFEEILALENTNVMGMLGLAQARLRLGEDAVTDIRKAVMVDRDYTLELIENHFDFRSRKPEDLVPRTLDDIAHSYGIPRRRVLARAQAGVLPAFPPEEEGGLLRFSQADLDRHYDILKILGLEIDGKAAMARMTKHEDAVQQNLFDDD